MPRHGYFRSQPDGFKTDWGGFGGARRNRTDDLLHAMQALSQLSYGPAVSPARDGTPSPAVAELRAAFCSDQGKLDRQDAKASGLRLAFNS
jgi:hypothetical protein